MTILLIMILMMFCTTVFSLPCKRKISPEELIYKHINLSSNLKQLVKRSDLQQNSTESSRKRKSISKTEKSQRSLQVANLILENDGINFTSTMKRHGLGLKTNKKSYENSPGSDTAQKMHELSRLVDVPKSSNFNHPSSPTKHKLRELDQWLNSPIKDHRSLQSSSQGPPSPTTQKMNEFKHLIDTTPPSKAPKDKSNKVVTPFTKDVVRKGPRLGSKQGYRTNKNVIALAAETSMKDGKTTKVEEALRIGQEKLEEKKAKNRNYVKQWREIAAKNPEEAGKMKQRVPLNIPQKLYVSARTHQLMYRGEAINVEEAKKKALNESEAVLKAKREKQAQNYAKQKILYKQHARKL
jgi:hypothetical protein